MRGNVCNICKSVFCAYRTVTNQCENALYTNKTKRKLSAAKHKKCSTSLEMIETQIEIMRYYFAYKMLNIYIVGTGLGNKKLLNFASWSLNGATILEANLLTCRRQL